MVAIFQHTVQSSARIMGVEGAVERELSQLWSDQCQFCFPGTLGRLFRHDFILIFDLKRHSGLNTQKV